MTAAITGRTEIGGAAVAITMVDVVVFLPIAFMSGIVGSYLREYGAVVVTATLFSLFVSFTLTPLLAAKWSVLNRSEATPQMASRARRSPCRHRAARRSRGRCSRSARLPAGSCSTRSASSLQRCSCSTPSCTVTMRYCRCIARSCCRSPCSTALSSSSSACRCSCSTSLTLVAGGGDGDGHHGLRCLLVVCAIGHGLGALLRSRAGCASAGYATCRRQSFCARWERVAEPRSPPL